MLEQGRELFKSGEFIKCERLLRKEVQLDDALPEIIELYAYTLQKIGEFEKAMGYWNILIAQDGQNAEFYCERGVCKFNLGFRSALEDMDKALELDPDNPYRHSTRAYILDKMGRTEEAYHAYLHAANLDPDDDIIQNNLGIIEYKLGYSAESRQRFMEQEERLGLSGIHSAERHTGSQGQENHRKPEGGQSAQHQPSRWVEIRKMLSSWKEFRQFLKEAKNIFTKPKS